MLSFSSTLLLVSMADDDLCSDGTGVWILLRFIQKGPRGCIVTLTTLKTTKSIFILLCDQTLTFFLFFLYSLTETRVFYFIQRI